MKKQNTDLSGWTGTVKLVPQPDHKSSINSRFKFCHLRKNTQRWTDEQRENWVRKMLPGYKKQS